MGEKDEERETDGPQESLSQRVRQSGGGEKEIYIYIEREREMEREWEQSLSLVLVPSCGWQSLPGRRRS